LNGSYRIHLNKMQLKAVKKSEICFASHMRKLIDNRKSFKVLDSLKFLNISSKISAKLWNQTFFELLKVNSHLT